MGKTTGIEWTDGTWNPWRGCTKVSPGCENCYMFTGMGRFGLDPDVVTRAADATFRKPLVWAKKAAPSQAPGWDGRPLIFTCSWGDWFHRDADPWRDDAWAIVRQAPGLVFQVLTKRHGRIETNLPANWGDGYENVWLGVAGEDSATAKRRVRHLATIPCAVRFLSYEPALGPIDWDAVLGITDPLTGECALDWVIVGGESGPGARPFDVAWARQAIEACKRYGVACFVKQMGTAPLRRFYGGAWAVPLGLTDRKGGDWSEWPADLRVREWPEGAS